MGYFDLLGTKNLIKSKSIINVFSIYAKAIEEASKTLKRMPKINSTWFSDTFLIFSSDGEGANFAEIDYVSRWFVYFLINSSIPVRGAISFGEFYVDKSNSLYFGPALIEAYEYGEAQDWIGFLLCPSASKQMKVIELPADQRINYAYWNIPFKKRDYDLTSRLPAYIVGDSVKINGKNVCLEKLKEMKNSQSDDRIIKKYDNTIDFITKNKRTIAKT